MGSSAKATSSAIPSTSPHRVDGGGYRCNQCGRTFSSTHGTPYYRLHKPRSLFDEVVHMCVHGLAISAMARIKRMAWGTVARWLESAATFAIRFNDRMLKGFVIRELQADEIRTFVGTKKRVIYWREHMFSNDEYLRRRPSQLEAGNACSVRERGCLDTLRKTPVSRLKDTRYKAGTAINVPHGL